MADENTDVKDEQPVDAQVKTDATDSQAVSQPDTGANDVKLADGQSVADKTVPYTRFEEANKAAKEAKAAAEAAQAYAAQLQAQISQQGQPKPTDLFTQTVQRLGLQDEVYLSLEQQGQVFNAMFDTISANSTDTAFIASHHDYADVVGTTDMRGNFIPAAPLQRVFSKNPQLMQAIMSSPQSKILAYELAVADPDYQESIKNKDLPQDVKDAADAKAIVAASARQASISAAATGQGSTDKAQAVRNMTDEQFEKYKNTIIARAN